MKIKKLSFIAVIMTFVMFVLTLSPIATALLNKSGSITLNLTDSETKEPLKNTFFRLYLVADAIEQGNGLKYELIPPYDNANIDLSDLEDSSLPIHLAYFAESSSLPYTEKSTDKNGLLVFDNLTLGLYLVVPVQTSEDYHTPSPFLVSVPTYDSQNNTWKYDVDASPKFIGGGGVDTETYISVVKKWDTDSHPESITVVLLRDFKEYAKVELNDSNNWHYRWDKLSKKYIWDVVEKNVPDGYTVHYESSSNTVTIINKSDSQETTKPTTKPDSGKPTKPPEDDKLAQTGQLNWPVPVFAIAGLLIFSLGWAILNLGKKESE